MYTYVHIHLVFNKQIKYFIITIYIIFMYISFCPLLFFHTLCDYKIYHLSLSHKNGCLLYFFFSVSPFQNVKYFFIQKNYHVYHCFHTSF